MKRTLSTAFYQPNNNTDINDEDEDTNNDPAPKPVPPTMHVRNATPDPIGPADPSQATPIQALGPITQPLLVSRGQTTESQQASQSTQQISMQTTGVNLAYDVNQLGLMVASGLGDLSTVQAHLSNGADVNATDILGLTPLMCAVRSGHLPTVQALLGVSGININTQDPRGATALSRAVLFGKVDVVKALIAHGADVNAADNNGWTPLMLAAYKGDLTSVQALLGVSDIDIDDYNSDEATALYLAVSNGNYDMVKALIAHGADVNVATKYGFTPLICAAEKGDLTSVQALLGVSGIDIHAKNSDGATALIVAASNGKDDIVKALIDKGANVNAAHKNGWTPLMFASAYGDLTTVQALLGVSGIDIHAKKSHGATALIVAAANDQVDVVKELINNGADVNAADEDGWTSLMFAAEKGHLTTVQALLSAPGIDIDAQKSYGDTALSEAISNVRYDVVKALLDHGADLTQVIKNYKTLRYEYWYLSDESDKSRFATRQALMDYLAQRQADVGNLQEETTWASTFATSAIPPKASEEVIPSLQALALDTLIQQAQVEGPSLLQISFQANRDQLLQHKLSATQVGDLIRLLHNSSFAKALVQTLALAIKLGGYREKSDLDLIDKKLKVFDLFDAYKKSQSHLEPENINRWQVSGQTLLTRAAQAGDQLLVDALINCGAALHLPDQHGNNALHAAVKAGQWSVCGHLLALGANANTSDRSGVSTLTYLAQAFAKEDEQTAAFIASLLAPLLAKGYRLDRIVENPNPSRPWGKTMILNILQSNVNRYGSYLGVLHADKVNLADIDGNTPLMFAAKHDLLEILRVLIDKGADVNAANKKGWTPLMFASIHEHPTIIQALLSAPKIDINAENNGGTALIVALVNGKADAVKMLINNGAVLNVFGKDGWTLLMSAAKRGHVATMQAFLSVPKIDIDEKKLDGETALHVAAYHGKDDFVKALINNGAGVNAADNNGWTALMSAANQGNLTTVQVLLDKGANIKQTNADGLTVLDIIAIKEPNEVNLKLLELLRQYHT